MGFGDLKSKAGQQALDSYLADRSYIEGFVASQADSVVYKALPGAPPADLVNALRWYNHITSYGDSKTSFPGIGKSIGAYGPATGGDDDSDSDLFGDSDSDDEEADEELQAKLKAYHEKKAKKPALIAKSTILLDVKPWDDETDMMEMEKKVRGIVHDGLLWGASKLVPVGYGIKKLQINCVVEDDKVGTDFLEEEITKYEDLVQSVDIAAFNKI